ncbi:MAG: 23S rRNA (guanosine(2251)-2'-O)-methyltransferase RlmB [Bacillota bacterium]
MEWIEGRNPVRELLRAGRRRALEVVLAEGIGGKDIDALEKRAASLGVRTSRAPRRVLDQRSDGAVHQGVMARCEPYPYSSLEDLLDCARSRREDLFIVFADHIEDPHNLGSLIRTAEEAGVHGVIIPNRRAAPVTPAVVKASAGATEHMQVARVTNLVRTAERLKVEHVWFFGADAGGVPVYDVNLSGPVALCVGGEARGLSRLLAETCDEVVALPSRGRIGSLNASVAGAVLMYEVVRRRTVDLNSD